MAVKIVAVVAILAYLALYLVFTAQRLDRLHARIDAAGAALDRQLQRRSATAADFARVVPLVPDIAVALASRAVDASVLRGLGAEREQAENALSRSLVAVAVGHPEAFDGTTRQAVELHDAALRATYARRFYNDAVRDALVVRDRRTVRWLRLAGSAPHPAYFEMDDEELPSPTLNVVARS